MWSVIFSLIKTEEIIRSLSCKNPFCAIVKGLRLSKASEEQIPTAMSEETTKRVNYHKNGNLPLFYIEKDTRVGVLYAPFACVLMAYPTGVEPATSSSGGLRSIQLSYGYIFVVFTYRNIISHNFPLCNKSPFDVCKKISENGAKLLINSPNCGIL